MGAGEGAREADAGGAAALARWFAVGGALRVAALVLAALLVFAPGQTALPPSDRDEARFAQATKQMLETGDFVDIRFQDQARHKKPVGIYWLQAASASLAGGIDAPIWAYRIPSLIGAALAAGLTAWALAPLMGSALAPLGGWGAAALAAAMIAATPLLHVEARIAKTDAALLASIVIAQGALARLWLARESAGWGMRLLFWGAVGAGVLLKGPIVLLPAGGAIAWLSIAERSAAGLRALRPLAGLGIVALIALPWLVMITLASDGAFWRESVGEDLLGKVAGGAEKHWGPPGYHLLAFWGVFWPWAALAPFAALWAWRRRRETAFGFMLGWIIPSWLVFEIAPTKLPHYVMVAWPAIAGLLALALVDGAAFARARPWARRAALIGFAIPAGALTLGAALAAPVIEGRIVWGAVALAAAAAVALWMAGRALRDWRLGAFLAPAGAGAVLVYAAVFQFALPALDRAFVSPRMAAAAAEWRCGATTPLAVTHYREPSAIFLLGTDTLNLKGDTAARALAEGAASLAFVEARDRPAFDAEAARLGIGFEPLAAIEGFNYSRGRPTAMTLFGPPGQQARCGR